MKQAQKRGGNLGGIDFTADEVEDFLTKAGYIVEDFMGIALTRYITGMDGGGGVELSDLYEVPVLRRIAYLPGQKPVNLLERRDYYHDPQFIFKEVMKQKLLKI